MKTRRAFIQTGAVALCGLAAAPALAKPRKPKDADWTETFDVIVIGSGLAAFVAGLSALESGAKRVALLEKMGMLSATGPSPCPAARSKRHKALKTLPKPCSRICSRPGKASAIPS